MATGHLWRSLRRGARGDVFRTLLGAVIGVLLALTCAAPALGQGGTTVATATPIAFDQVQAGDDSAMPAHDTPFGAYPSYDSWWALAVATGDQVTMSWQATSPDAGLAIWQVGSTDATVRTTHAVEGEGNGYVDSSTGVANKIRFTATATGVMPLDIFNENDFQAPSPPGPYSFTVHIDPPPATGTPAPPADLHPRPVEAPAAARACSPSAGSLGQRLLASLRCTAADLILEAKCGVGVALLVSIPAKTLNALKSAHGLYDLRKVPRKYRPVARLVNDIEGARFGPHAPRGFRTGREVIRRLDEAKNARDVLLMLPSLAKAVSRRDYSQIALDVADLAGLHSCVQAMSNAVS